MTVARKTRLLHATPALMATALLLIVPTAKAEDAGRTNPKSPAKIGQPQSAPRTGYLQAFFERSLLDISRAQAREALRKNPRDVEALFVEMEAAALEADTPAVLEAATRMLELRGAVNDDRISIAAARLNDLAANTQEFRAVLPRLLVLAGRSTAHVGAVRAALVKAAADGLHGLITRDMAKQAGLLTDWRAAGPFGDYANLDFNRAWPPQQDLLMGGASDGRRIELFRFDDGKFRLPEYFGSNGVYYAMSETTVSGGSLEVRAESAGTLEIFIDGKSVLRHDSRFRVEPSTTTAPVRLTPGTHKILVKFLPSAIPFRIAVTRPEPALAVARAIPYSPEVQYVAAALKYWAGDYAGAVAAFQQLSESHGSAAADWMLYRAWEHAENNAPEANALLHGIVEQTPEALAAEYEIAARAYAAERIDDALVHLERVLGKREHFVPAQQLMGDLAVRLHSPVRAARAMEILVNIHPSCDVLRRAQRFFAGYARYDRARKIDADLAECASDSIAFAISLGESGRHAEAAAAAQQVVSRNPLDRDAREFLARELALAGRPEEARAASRALAELAPNSGHFRWMAAAANIDPLAITDSSDNDVPSSDQQPFYAAYRRDGIEQVKNAANRRFSGGPALLILDDQVTRLWPDGTVSQYVHRITRALDRSGVEKYGEVDLPRGAELLELRTIKADGAIAEPELTTQKATISMPGLLPGDAVDEEYVVHYTDADSEDSQAAFTHSFGSFRAPMLASRFVVLTPADHRQWIQATGAAPGLTESRHGDVNERVWEKKDIAQSVEEVASAKGDILPTVRISPALQRGWEDVRDQMRELAVDVARVGTRVQLASLQFHGDSDDALARTLYRAVTATVRSTASEFDEDTPTAEQTLSEHAGSRTAALLALSSAVGIHADLVLARNAGTINAVHGPAKNVYTRPLVRFRLRDSSGTTHDVVVDAESDSLAFGILPPTIARRDSLLVTLPDAAHNASVESAILRLPEKPALDESVARAEVTLLPDGAIQADVTILLGAWRGSQMRGILAGIDKPQRGHFYEQLAARIFPGAENVTGEARNESNPDRTLELVVHCTAPRFVNVSGGAAELEQLVPTLGLKKMYVTGPSRQFPLFVDTPLFETATFRIHLPNGTSVIRPARDLQLNSAFGKYSVTFREVESGVLEVKRTFDVPVQVVVPERYAEFARFANQIDDAEKQKIGLEMTRLSAGAGQ